MYSDEGRTRQEEPRSSRPHDVGGKDFDDPVNVPDHPISDWELTTDAIGMVLMGKGMFAIDEIRNAREQVSPDRYLEASYYELSIMALERWLVANEVLTREEIERKVTEVRESWG